MIFSFDWPDTQGSIHPTTKWINPSFTELPFTDTKPSLNSRDDHPRTSGVSSGATSGSGLSYWHHPTAKTGAASSTHREQQRKFPTLSRPSQQKIKSNPILRTRSFQVHHNPKLSQFSPSENSAFHCLPSNNNAMTQVRGTIILKTWK